MHSEVLPPAVALLKASDPAAWLQSMQAAAQMGYSCQPPQAALGSSHSTASIGSGLTWPCSQFSEPTGVRPAFASNGRMPLDFYNGSQGKRSWTTAFDTGNFQGALHAPSATIDSNIAQGFAQGLQSALLSQMLARCNNSAAGSSNVPSALQLLSSTGTLAAQPSSMYMHDLQALHQLQQAQANVLLERQALAASQFAASQLASALSAQTQAVGTLSLPSECQALPPVLSGLAATSNASPVLAAPSLVLPMSSGSPPQSAGPSQGVDKEIDRVGSNLPPELQARLRKKIRIIQPISSTWEAEALQRDRPSTTSGDALDQGVNNASIGPKRCSPLPSNTQTASRGDQPQTWNSGHDPSHTRSTSSDLACTTEQASVPNGSSGPDVLAMHKGGSLVSIVHSNRSQEDPSAGYDATLSSLARSHHPGPRVRLSRPSNGVGTHASAFTPVQETRPRVAAVSQAPEPHASVQLPDNDERAAVLEPVQGQLYLLYHWYVTNRSAYLAQASEIMKRVEQESAGQTDANGQNSQVAAVARAFEKALHIMRTSCVVESQWQNSVNCSQQAAAAEPLINNNINIEVPDGGQD